MIMSWYNNLIIIEDNDFSETYVIFRWKTKIVNDEQKSPSDRSDFRIIYHLNRRSWWSLTWNGSTNPQCGMLQNGQDPPCLCIFMYFPDILSPGVRTTGLACRAAKLTYCSLKSEARHLQWILGWMYSNIPRCRIETVSINRWNFEVYEPNARYVTVAPFFAKWTIYTIQYTIGPFSRTMDTLRKLQLSFPSDRDLFTSEPWSTHPFHDCSFLLGKF
jgi:hypothetical protein